MSILIKGEPMPPNCEWDGGSCPCYNDDRNMCWATGNELDIFLNESRPEWCPLIEVTEYEAHDEQGNVKKCWAERIE